MVRLRTSQITKKTFKSLCTYNKERWNTQTFCETNRIGEITKRGNSTLRKYLIHGARTVLNWHDKKDDLLSKKTKKANDSCKAVVALVKIS